MFCGLWLVFGFFFFVCGDGDELERLGRPRVDGVLVRDYVVGYCELLSVMTGFLVGRCCFFCVSYGYLVGSMFVLIFLFWRLVLWSCVYSCVVFM